MASSSSALMSANDAEEFKALQRLAIQLVAGCLIHERHVDACRLVRSLQRQQQTARSVSTSKLSRRRRRRRRSPRSQPQSMSSKTEADDEGGRPNKAADDSCIDPLPPKLVCSSSSWNPRSSPYETKFSIDDGGAGIGNTRTLRILSHEAASLDRARRGKKVSSIPTLIEAISYCRNFFGAKYTRLFFVRTARRHFRFARGRLWFNSDVDEGSADASRSRSRPFFTGRASCAFANGLDERRPVPKIFNASTRNDWDRGNILGFYGVVCGRTDVKMLIGGRFESARVRREKSRLSPPRY